MTSWLLKAAVQNAISPLPARDRLNGVLQRLTASTVITDARFDVKVAQCRRHLEAYAACHGEGALPSCVLELGTGWSPIVPVGLALAGVASVLTADVRPLLDRRNTERTLKLYMARLQQDRLAAMLPAVDSKRVQQLPLAGAVPATQQAAELLKRLGVRVLVGREPERHLPARSVDLIVSNNTLEHIPPVDLCALLARLRRLTVPDAVLSHFIDMSDHYAHFDHRISEFNHLRFSDPAWQLVNNRLQYHNRLLASDYRDIFEDAGFALVSDDRQRGSQQELSRIKLASRFQRRDVDDLLTLRAWITAVAHDASGGAGGP
ncbi:MAG: methyltransferase domain-containing protein [Solirubrobacteraceae bacterium]